MFGRYNSPFHYENGDILVETERKDGLLTYRRRCEGKAFERILVSERGEIIINPVEPVNLPKEVTSILQIEFSPMVIEPGTSQTVYLKFPVEVGVFLRTERAIEILDVFGTGNQKYTLYGPPTSGVIARWYASAIYPRIPPVERLREGVMELSIQNASHDWAEVSCVAFDSVNMKVYYDDEIVGASATMKVITPMMAETNFIDAPLRPGMARSIELYTARKIQVISHGFLMEWGLS
jgi:hypothetical protein